MDKDITSYLRKAKLALEQLDLDAEIRLTLLLEEFLHTVNVIHFFAKPRNEENKSTSLSSMFRKLEDIPKSIIESFSKVINKYQNFKNTIYELQNHSEDFLALKLFSEYVGYSFEERNLLQEMDFIQTKLVSLLESFQKYHPSPKESSIKDATKIHFYLEKIAEDLLLLFGNSFITEKENKNKPDKAFFFWKFTPEINFLKNERNLFIIDSDSFLPNRQITWIILAHETLHYLYSIYKYSESKNNLFRRMHEYARRWETVTAIAFARNRIRSSKVDAEIYFVDVLIDVILTEIFSYKYAFPALLYLFTLDEGESVSLPDWNRFWTIRYRAILERIKEKIENENNEGIKNLINSFGSLFEAYQRTQKFYGFPNVSNLYLEEEILSRTSKELISSFLKNSKESIENLKRKLELDTGENGNVDELKYLKTYLLTLDKYYEYLTEKVQENALDKGKYKEGRAFCRTLLEATLYGYEKVKELEEYIKDYFEKPVYKFQFYRVRYDDDENNINELYKALMGEENSLRKFVDAYCFGSYTFLYISKEEEYEKVSKYEKCGKDDNAWKNLERVVSSNQENVNSSNEEDLIRCPEIYLMNKLRFFRHDYSLTLYSDNEGNLVSILRNSKDYIYIFVKYNVNNVKNFQETNDLNNVENFQKINDLFDKFKQKIEKHCEDISIFHFISFEWYDYLTLIAIKPSGIEFHLNKVLKALKELVLIGNNGILGRTETDIFVGLNILDKVIVKTPHIHLRVSSESLGETKEKIIPALKGKNFEVSLRFGIRDLVIKEEGGNYFEDNFKNLLNRIYKDILLGEDLKGKFSDIQFIVEVDSQ